MSSLHTSTPAACSCATASTIPESDWCAAGYLIVISYSDIRLRSWSHGKLNVIVTLSALLSGLENVIMNCVTLGCNIM